MESAIGKIPLGLQQLALAQMRLREAGLIDQANLVTQKMAELASKIDASAFDATPGLESGQTPE